MLEKQIAQLENENVKLKLDHEREMQAYKIIILTIFYIFPTELYLNTKRNMKKSLMIIKEIIILRNLPIQKMY